MCIRDRKDLDDSLDVQQVFAHPVWDEVMSATNGPLQKWPEMVKIISNVVVAALGDTKAFKDSGQVGTEGILVTMGRVSGVAEWMQSMGVCTNASTEVWDALVAKCEDL